MSEVNPNEAVQNEATPADAVPKEPAADGTVLNENAINEGIAEEAGRQILKYGFETIGLNRIYLYTETGNTAAQHLFDKLGFVREGCLRADVLSHGKTADRYVYALLRADWEKMNAEDGHTGAGND